MLSFSNLESLRGVLDSEILPAPAVANSVRYTIDESGGVIVEVAKSLEKPVLAALRKIGVKQYRTKVTLDRESTCWAAMLPLVRADLPMGRAIFALAASELISFASEITRLSGRVPQWRLIGNRALIPVSYTHLTLPTKRIV